MSKDLRILFKKSITRMQDLRVEDQDLGQMKQKGAKIP